MSEHDLTLPAFERKHFGTSEAQALCVFVLYAACRTDKGYWETSDSVFVSLAKAQPSGMLLAYHPTNRSTIALMNNLWFANGVALAHDESYVLVADSVQMKIMR
jgi:sugar lactone lactonase YvrE